MSAQTETSALLLFTIGPVQDFIAAARRTQDLWMGSYVLAYLSYKAMETVISASPLGEQAILYPVLEGHPFHGLMNANGHSRLLRLATLPNKFTAQVTSVDEGKEMADKAETAVYQAWRNLAKHVHNHFPDSLLPSLNKAMWDNTWQRQIAPEKWLELYWIVYPNNGYTDGELNRRAEQALAARKGLRNFAPVPEIGEKDSISGKRAVLSSNPDWRRSQQKEEWRALSRALYKQSLLKTKNNPYKGLTAALDTEGNERLSAIETVKRFVQRFYFDSNGGDDWELEGGFPSTSSVASAVYRQELLAKLNDEANEFALNLGRIRGDDPKEPAPKTLSPKAFPPLSQQYAPHLLLSYDGEFFYPETYTTKRLAADYGVAFNDSQLGELKTNLRELQRAAKEKKVAPPPKYYALLLMDGDRMGRNLSQAQGVAEIKEISRKLQRYALERVLPIVEDQYLGRVVYAGGDDLMAFLPLEHVLDAADALNKAFEETTGFKASAGVAIAHHLAPLDRVLQAARAAEKQAKERYGRNSIVFSVLKRSGEQLDVGAHWAYQELHLLPIIRLVRDYMLDETVSLSARFAFDAEREAIALTELEKRAHEKRLAVLLHRHSRNMAETDRLRLADNLAQIAEGLQSQLRQAVKMGNVEPDEEGGKKIQPSGSAELARWLLLARFLVAAATGED